MYFYSSFTNAVHLGVYTCEYKHLQVIQYADEAKTIQYEKKLINFQLSTQVSVKYMYYMQYIFSLEVWTKTN